MTGFQSDMTTFENKQINSSELTNLDELTFEKLEPDYRKVNIMQSAIFLVILLVIYIVVGIFNPFLLTGHLVWIVVLSWLVVTIASLVINYISYDYEGYALRQKDIIYKSGIFFRSTTIIPFKRIQHSEIKQGPIDRIFNLSSLSFYTAGGSSSDLSIPGLTDEVAQSLKDFISKQVATDEEE